MQNNQMIPSIVYYKINSILVIYYIIFYRSSHFSAWISSIISFIWFSILVIADSVFDFCDNNIKFSLVNDRLKWDCKVSRCKAATNDNFSFSNDCIFSICLTNIVNSFSISEFCKRNDKNNVHILCKVIIMETLIKLILLLITVNRDVISAP